MELARDFRKQTRAWQRVHELTAPTDVVAVNPVSFKQVTMWTANAPMSLFSDRNTLVSDASTPLVFSRQVNEDRFWSDLAFLRRFFNKTVRASDVERLALEYRAQAILVTPRDALWNYPVLDESPYYFRAAGTPDYRIYRRRAFPPDASR
jgi:hypothetical protein